MLTWHVRPSSNCPLSYILGWNVFLPLHCTDSLLLYSGKLFMQSSDSSQLCQSWDWKPMYTLRPLHRCRHCSSMVLASILFLSSPSVSPSLTPLTQAASEYLAAAQNVTGSCLLKQKLISDFTNYLCICSPNQIITDNRVRTVTCGGKLCREDFGGNENQHLINLPEYIIGAIADSRLTLLACNC